MTIRVYRYGCRPPIENGPLVDQQIRLAHRYRNALTEIELSRRALIPPRCPCAVASADGRCACAACVQPAKPAHCRASDAAWALARGLAIGHANAASAETLRRARAACGVFWGSYLLAEAANDAQRRSPDLPRFKRWDGSGRIGVQLQRGLAVADLLACGDTRLRLAPVVDDGRAHSRRHDPAYGIGRTVVWLRVGSDGRAPVWATFPVFLHRPLPAGGVIKWAVVTRVRIGTVWRYELHLTVEEQASAQADDARTSPTRSGTVAVDLGWRRRDAGLRAAYWADDSGAHGELRLPAEMEDKLGHARSLLSIRERAFTSERQRLARDLVADRDLHLPDWLIGAARTMVHWRSADRLYALYWRWRHARFDGDVAIFTDFAAWAKQDRHLHDWADHEADKVIARRRDIVRVFAAGLARKYARVIVEDVDVRQLIAKRKESEIAKNASPNRHLVAPGMLRLAIRQACARHGAEYVEVPCAYTTQRCVACGHVEPFDAAAQVDRRPPCSACGDASDQDWIAARNLLASGSVAQGPSDPLAGGKGNGNGKIRRSGRFRRARGASQPDGCSQVGCETSVGTTETT